MFFKRWVYKNSYLVVWLGLFPPRIIVPGKRIRKFAMHAFHFYLHETKFRGLWSSSVCPRHASTFLCEWTKPMERKLYWHFEELSFFFILDVKFIQWSNILDNNLKNEKTFGHYIQAELYVSFIELNFSLMMQCSWIFYYCSFITFYMEYSWWWIWILEETGKISILKRGRRYLVFLPRVEFNEVILSNNLKIYILGKYMEIGIFWWCNIFVNNKVLLFLYVFFMGYSIWILDGMEKKN